MWAEADILAIAYDQSMLALLRSALESAGYRVRPASCGASALAAIAAQLPQLILLDLSMPGVDGVEICRQLKASDQAGMSSYSYSCGRYGRPMRGRPSSGRRRFCDEALLARRSYGADGKALGVEATTY